jgi:tRNA dimethylallyltransferase
MISGAKCANSVPMHTPDPVLRSILIAGPTASGKSGLALALAERLGGTIINADSLQVYRDLRLLTARPSPQDEARAPHALYGHVSGAEAYSAGRYAGEAARAIGDARAAGRVPIVVGGTGLYFKTLLEGLSPIPAADPQVRAFWRAEAARRPSVELHALLAKYDPGMAARLMPTDPQRIVRALEVMESTGRSLADWQRTPGRPVLAEAETARLLALPERADHGALIDARFDAMLAAGALEEVRGLLAQGLSDELPVMRALGVAPLVAHLKGALSLEQAAATAKSDTRKYAKRQLTWSRRNMITWTRVKTQYMEDFLAHEFPFILGRIDPASPAR